MTGRASSQPSICAVSSSVNGRFRSMKIIWGGSPLVVFSRKTAVRFPACSAPSRATAFETRRGMSTSQRRITSTPSGVRWS